MAAASLGAFAQPPALTTAETAQVEKCRRNLAPAALKSETALECADFLKADGGRILKSLEPVSAGDLLGKTLALANLATIIQNPGVREHELRTSLKLVLPCEYTPLCALALGPEPEKILDWARNRDFSEQRVKDIAEAILEWGGLDAEFRAGKNQNEWSGLDLTARSSAYRSWLRARCQDPKLRQENKERARRLAQLLEGEVPTEAAGPLKDCATILKARAEGREAPQFALDRGYSQASVRLQGVIDPKQADQFGALGKGFDGSKEGAGVLMGADAPQGAAGAPPGAVTPEQAQRLADALKKPLSDELRETIVGRKLLEFYEGPPLKSPGGKVLNSMDMDFQRFDNPKVMGAWDKEKIHFSQGYLEDWMKKTNQTPEKLLADKNSMAALARTLAPVLVHEGTHQTQTAFFKMNGIPHTLENVEEEIGAALNGALFVEENFLMKGPAYVVNLSSLDTRLHRVYKMRGIAGIKDDRNRTYQDLGLGSAFRFDQTAAEVYGNELMRKDYQSVAENPDDVRNNRKIASDVSRKIDQYGKLVKKYDDDAAWFRSVRGQLEDIGSRGK